MKITVIRHSIRNRGGDRLVLDYLSFLVARGHEVVYWTNEVATSFSIDPRIEIKHIPWPGATGTICFAAVTKFSSDIVLVDLAVMALFAYLLNGKKVVYLAQDDDRAYYSSPVMKVLMGFVFRLVFSLFKVHVISVSEYLTAELGKYSCEKIETVCNGIDLGVFYRETTPHAQIEKTTPMAVVLYARSDFRKGLDIGIKAVEGLARRRGTRDWELWIIGNDKAVINADGLKVKHWGFLKDDQLRSVFSAADVYLMPSRHEGLSLLLLSALACGCVVVATKASNILTHNVDGLVSSVEDDNLLTENLASVMEDKLLCQKLRQNGYALAAHYSLKKSCNLFERALRTWSGRAACRFI
ncbi:MAG: glycosyltransferase family 4 protein [Thermodesulfobacteriota bacterium]